uniref:Uncharacterized protein n=1 Tax=Chromera velia CCMP2878 TaxID=1169474 RepID=A0A0G4F0F8_9ALVE|eukprot:Cvel_14405.t1-p1 / transcript=Cvel_14405.t1 / gene=Cvel_14405 / organism=Chromera_velia_CCMP2878 / gene_product=hypothetical protein / transcript_product=hypothetical protein / location=Cvel_scaffold1023:47981-58158(-) / protein_length=1456 / sequence_SO=supercontig / SO=protein_coding / is_pseudo=false
MVLLAELESQGFKAKEKSTAEAIVASVFDTFCNKGGLSVSDDKEGKGHASKAPMAFFFKTGAAKTSSSSSSSVFPTEMEAGAEMKRPFDAKSSIMFLDFIKKQCGIDDKEMAAALGTTPSTWGTWVTKSQTKENFKILSKNPLILAPFLYDQLVARMKSSSSLSPAAPSVSPGPSAVGPPKRRTLGSVSGGARLSSSASVSFGGANLKESSRDHPTSPSVLSGCGVRQDRESLRQSVLLKSGQKGQSGGASLRVKQSPLSPGDRRSGASLSSGGRVHGQGQGQGAVLSPLASAAEGQGQRLLEGRGKGGQSERERRQQSEGIKGGRQESVPTPQSQGRDGGRSLFAPPSRAAREKDKERERPSLVGEPESVLERELARLKEENEKLKTEAEAIEKKYKKAKALLASPAVTVNLPPDIQHRLRPWLSSSASTSTAPVLPAEGEPHSHTMSSTGAHPLKAQTTPPKQKEEEKEKDKEFQRDKKDGPSAQAGERPAASPKSKQRGSTTPLFSPPTANPMAARTASPFLPTPPLGVSAEKMLGVELNQAKRVKGEEMETPATPKRASGGDTPTAERRSPVFGATTGVTAAAEPLNVPPAPPHGFFSPAPPSPTQAAKAKKSHFPNPDDLPPPSMPPPRSPILNKTSKGVEKGSASTAVEGKKAGITRPPPPPSFSSQNHPGMPPGSAVRWTQGAVPEKSNAETAEGRRTPPPIPHLDHQTGGEGEGETARPPSSSEKEKENRTPLSPRPSTVKQETSQQKEGHRAVPFSFSNDEPKDTNEEEEEEADCQPPQEPPLPSPPPQTSAGRKSSVPVSVSHSAPVSSPSANRVTKPGPSLSALKSPLRSRREKPTEVPGRASLMPPRREKEGPPTPSRKTKDKERTSVPFSASSGKPKTGGPKTPMPHEHTCPQQQKKRDRTSHHQKEASPSQTKKTPTIHKEEKKNYPKPHTAAAPMEEPKVRSPPCQKGKGQKAQDQRPPDPPIAPPSPFRPPTKSKSSRRASEKKTAPAPGPSATPAEKEKEKPTAASENTTETLPLGELKKLYKAHCGGMSPRGFSRKSLARAVADKMAAASGGPAHGASGSGSGHNTPGAASSQASFGGSQKPAAGEGRAQPPGPGRPAGGFGGPNFQQRPGGGTAGMARQAGVGTTGVHVGGATAGAARSGAGPVGGPQGQAAPLKSALPSDWPFLAVRSVEAFETALNRRLMTGAHAAAVARGRPEKDRAACFAILGLPVGARKERVEAAYRKVGEARETCMKALAVTGGQGGNRTAAAPGGGAHGGGGTSAGGGGATHPTSEWVTGVDASHVVVRFRLNLLSIPVMTKGGLVVRVMKPNVLNPKLFNQNNIASQIRFSALPQKNLTPFPLPLEIMAPQDAHSQVDREKFSFSVAVTLKYQDLGVLRPGERTLPLPLESPTLLVILRVRPVGDAWIPSPAVGVDGRSLPPLPCLEGQVTVETLPPPS